MKIRLASLLLGFAAITMSAGALARPVSYAGGWTLIETSNRASSAALLHYTPAYNYSVGARYEWMRGADIRMQAIQPTYLAKRWFGKTTKPISTLPEASAVPNERAARPQ